MKKGLGVPLEETMGVFGADRTGYHSGIGQMGQISQKEWVFKQGFFRQGSFDPEDGSVPSFWSGPVLTDRQTRANQCWRSKRIGYIGDP